VGVEEVMYQFTIWISGFASGIAITMNVMAIMIFNGFFKDKNQEKAEEKNPLEKP